MNNCIYCKDTDREHPTCICELEIEEEKRMWNKGYSDHYDSELPTMNDGGEPPQNPDIETYMMGWHFYDWEAWPDADLDLGAWDEGEELESPDS